MRLALHFPINTLPLLQAYLGLLKQETQFRFLRRAEPYAFRHQLLEICRVHSNVVFQMPRRLVTIIECDLMIVHQAHDDEADVENVRVDAHTFVFVVLLRFPRFVLLFMERSTRPNQTAPEVRKRHTGGMKPGKQSKFGWH